MSHEEYVRAEIVARNLEPVVEALDAATTETQYVEAGEKLAKAASRIADEHLEEEAKRFADDQVVQEAQAARYYSRLSAGEEAGQAYADAQCAAASPPCASRDARWDEFYASYLASQGKEARRNAVFQEVTGMRADTEGEVEAARLACRFSWSNTLKAAKGAVGSAVSSVKSAASSVAGFVSSAADKVKKVYEQAKSIYHKGKQIFDAGKGIFTDSLACYKAIKGQQGGSWKACAGAVNKTIKGFEQHTSLNVPSWLKGVGNAAGNLSKARFATDDDAQCCYLAQ
jgi:hypothetical protein